MAGLCEGGNEPPGFLKANKLSPCEGSEGQRHSVCLVKAEVFKSPRSTLGKRKGRRIIAVKRKESASFDLRCLLKRWSVVELRRRIDPMERETSHVFT
ncbi:hypothetical protein ANN_12207 [Periplaneta americana]|uniref:Uncharacterized protein n=1 Tax=Periplaneta americana TaxID=6978 RepID=A0ABQ8TGM8_PERAM|nr:hypothetical protein ANN_12207 [Periplaneta americana]